MKVLFYILIAVIALVIGLGIDLVRWELFTHFTHSNMTFWQYIWLFGGRK